MVSAMQWSVLALLIVISFLSKSQAFHVSSSVKGAAGTVRRSQRVLSTSLNAGLFGSSKEKSADEPSQPLPTRVLEIPVSSLKQGGLRFTLGLHLVGLQDKGTWSPNQSSDKTLDMVFKDNSAMFQIVLDEDAIRIDRYGSPSLAYVLQESLVLHSILDELNTLCFEGEIEEENRLLRLDEPCDAIERARSNLPARRA